MDTIQTLYEKYLHSQQNDIERGCVVLSLRTQILLAFVQEVEYRQSAVVNDAVTANMLLTYTANNYL
jgi:hypothetical protein